MLWNFRTLVPVLGHSRTTIDIGVLVALENTSEIYRFYSVFAAMLKFRYIFIFGVAQRSTVAKLDAISRDRRLVPLPLVE